MLKSLIAGLLALLATFGLHHSAITSTPVAQSPYADTGLLQHHLAQTAAAAAATTETASTTTPSFQDLSSFARPTSAQTTSPQPTQPPIAPASQQLAVIDPPGDYITPGDLGGQINDVEAWVREYVAKVTSTVASAQVPQQVAAGGNGYPFAAASAIGQLSNTAISTPTITGGSITGVAVSGITGLTTSQIGGFAYATTTMPGIATWGDSLTAGYGGTPYPSQLSLLTGYNVYNGGENGDTSTQIATRMLAAPTMDSWPTIIWAGRNNYSNEAQVDADIASMVTALQSVGNDNYIILSILNGEGEGTGTTAYNEIIQDNNDLATIYGSHYLDVRSYLVSQYNPNLPQDVTDHSNDIPPTSLRDDFLHPNSAGYLKVAQFIQSNINLLIPQSTTPPLLTTQNLGSIFQHPAIFAFVNSVAGFQQNGQTVLYASSTDGSTLVGMAAGLNLNGSDLDNTAVGDGSLGAATSSEWNTALGFGALHSNTTGNANTGEGFEALYSNATGTSNVANGFEALYDNTTGYSNAGTGAYTLYGNTTGYQNSATGMYALYSNATGFDNSANGFQALFYNTGDFNTAAGVQALYDNTTGFSNVADGVFAMESNTTGGNNTAIGTEALQLTTTAAGDTANGNEALRENNTGSYNVGDGYFALYYNASATSSAAVGANAGRGTALYHNQGASIFGYQSGYSFQTGSDFNTLFGYQSGYGITTGSNNIWIGAATSSSGVADLTTGSQNILIGNNISLPSATASGQLDIGNILYGTNNTGTGSTVSSGNLGVGTTNPYSRLQVTGPDTASTFAFAVVNSASTTVFSVFDDGNSTYSGSIFQSSDERLKTDIVPLNGSSSLAAILSLNPISYSRIDQPETGENLGFLAQAVQTIFPELVSTTSPTALTPNGTLTLNYTGLIAPIVSAIQDLANEISSLESTVAGFAQSFTSNQITATNELCIGTTCIDQQQLAAILASQEGASSGQGSGSSDASATSTPDTPPVIQINGDNPASIDVGATYNDLGVDITAPAQDLNLGIEASVDGGATTTPNQLTIDTSQPGTHTILYCATDQSGLTTCATRTVNVVSTASDATLSPTS